MLGLIFILMFVSFCVLFAYLYAYVPFGVLSLSKRLSIRISFFIFYAIFTLLIAFARLDIVVIMPYTIAIVILSILILKKKVFHKLYKSKSSNGWCVSFGLYLAA